MACGCGKRRERLAAAKKAVTAAATPAPAQQGGPAIWSGKPAEEGKT